MIMFICGVVVWLVPWWLRFEFGCGFDGAVAVCWLYILFVVRLIALRWVCGLIWCLFRSI